MNFNIFNSIILAGILQGFVFGAVILFSPKYKAPATRWLGLLIAIFSLNNLQYYLGNARIITSDQLYTLVFIPFQLLSGPLILFYGLRLIYPDRRITRKNYMMLIPFLVGFTYSSIYKTYRGMGLYDEAYFRFSTYVLAGIELFSILFDISIVLYLIGQIRKVSKHEAPMQTVRPELGWFRSILWSFFGLSFVWLAVTLLALNAIGNWWYIIWIAISVMIYWLGHIGVYKFGVQEERKKIRTFRIEHTRETVYEKPQSETIASFIRFVNTGKRYLDPNLTLDLVADELKISKTHLSRLINSELETGFPDYVNNLRIEEAKSYLTNPDFENYTLIAIGLEAGFSSKTTFNQTFKKVTGQTPSEYKSQFGNTILKKNIA
ncbi:helix-turn-helix transcriptional regulator [Flavobacterium silvaticum]|uniref:Helix-turn-helix transcriptional regulator n=1 Tax=Flavobacterium silvaticum TaxID=1852020 RepID=A0A972FM40_9FLAO|nr:helix-turn-helix transcriptional regulator [Flavobacterium silvaticum]NMH28172.1 helix-turn-helix transcriptional regulator [Flavobacterium silvaticum]